MSIKQEGKWEVGLSYVEGLYTVKKVREYNGFPFLTAEEGILSLDTFAEAQEIADRLNAEEANPKEISND